MTLYHIHNQAKSTRCFGLALGQDHPTISTASGTVARARRLTSLNLAFLLNAGYCFYEAAVGSSDQRDTIWGTVEWDGGLGNDYCTRAAS